VISLKEILSQRVREVRKAQGLTQGDLAKKSGLSVTFVGAIERAKQAATIETLERLAAALGVAPTALLTLPRSPTVMPNPSHPRERIIALLRGEPVGKLELAERILREVLRPASSRPPHVVSGGDEARARAQPAPDAGYPATIRPEHAKALRAAGITPAVAAARDYRSVEGRGELEVPVRSVDGGSPWSQFRVDRPRGGAPRFRIDPKLASAMLDVPPAGRDGAVDPARRLYVTDSPWAADAGVSRGLACVAVVGADIIPMGGRDWRAIPLEHREVYLVYESDSQNAFAERHALECLVVEAANVSVIRLPDQMRLDDFLAAGHSEVELLGLVEEQDAW